MTADIEEDEPETLPEEIVHWQPNHRGAALAEARGAVAHGASATGTSIVGSLAMGALALGAIAIGAMAIGALAIGRLQGTRSPLRPPVGRRPDRPPLPRAGARLRPPAQARIVSTCGTVCAEPPADADRLDAARQAGGVVGLEIEAADRRLALGGLEAAAARCGW